MDGTVIDVQVFTRDGVDKDERAISIEKDQLRQVRNELAGLRASERDAARRADLPAAGFFSTAIRRKSGNTIGASTHSGG